MSPALDFYAPPQPRRPADVAKGQRLPQTSPLVNYRYGIDPEQSCGTCQNFQSPGACSVVTGMIRPVDTCDLWEKDPAKVPPVGEPWALPAEQGPNGVSQAPEVDDPEQLQSPGSPEDPTQAGVYAPQPRKGVVGPVRASLAGARVPAQAYFPHRDPARAYFVREPAQAYFKESAVPGTDEHAAVLEDRGWQFHANDHDTVVYVQPDTNDEVRVWDSGNWIRYSKDQAVVAEGQGVDTLRRNLPTREAGTPEGAKKGWEKRKRGGDAGVPVRSDDKYSGLRAFDRPRGRGQWKNVSKALQKSARDANLKDETTQRRKAEAVVPVRAILVEVGTKEGGRKGSLTRRGRNALMRRLMKSEREISLGHVKIGKVRI